MLAQPTGTVLVAVEGRHITAVEVDTGRVEESSWPGGPGSRPDALLARGADVVAVGNGTAWRFRPFSGTPPVELGPAEVAVPAARDDRVWLETPSGLSTTIREVSLADGRVTATDVVLPIDSRPVAGVPGGLLVSQFGSVALLDPDSGDARTVALGEVVGASGTSVAVLSCEDGLSCGLRLVDVATGAKRTVPPPPGAVAFTAYPAPSGWPASADALVIGLHTVVGTEGLTPPVARVDIGGGTAIGILLGTDVRGPLTFDPDLRFAFAVGLRGMIGGPLGTPLVELPLNFGASPLLTAVRRD